MIKQERISVCDSTYLINSDASARVVIKWIGQYWKEPEIDPDISSITLVDLVQGWSDFDMLAADMLRTESGVVCSQDNVPFDHVPKLLGPLRERLRIKEFFKAMRPEREGQPVVVETDGGPEKNLLNGLTNSPTE